jgi:hypothetical protein
MNGRLTNSFLQYYCALLYAEAYPIPHRVRKRKGENLMAELFWESQWSVHYSLIGREVVLLLCYYEPGANYWNMEWRISNYTGWFSVCGGYNVRFIRYSTSLSSCRLRTLGRIPWHRSQIVICSLFQFFSTTANQINYFNVYTSEPTA